jgi:hypothetical protein
MRGTSNHRWTPRRASFVSMSRLGGLTRPRWCHPLCTREGCDCRRRRRGPKVRQERGRADESREAHHTARPLHSPEGLVPRPTGVKTDAEVATGKSTRRCSSCLIAVDLREWSPRRDSNPRPSDYESVPSLPAGPAQTHPGCSSTEAISSRTVLWCLVSAPGLPKWLPTI